MSEVQWSVTIDPPEWNMPIHIGGVWPIYWAEDSSEDKRRYFLGKNKLLTYLTARRFTTPNFKVNDPQGILT